MPIYEYECAKCHTIFEVLQKFSDDPLKRHAGCGGKVKRLLSTPSFHFKGSGFYITDYAKSGSKAEAGSESKAEAALKSETKSADGKASDTKPAADSKTAETKSAAESDKTGTKSAGTAEKAKTSSSKKKA